MLKLQRAMTLRWHSNSVPSNTTELFIRRISCQIIIDVLFVYVDRIGWHTLDLQFLQGGPTSVQIVGTAVMLVGGQCVYLQRRSNTRLLFPLRNTETSTVAFRCPPLEKIVLCRRVIFGNENFVLVLFVWRRPHIG